MTTTARDIMTSAPDCIGVNDSTLEAAQQMAKLDIGAMPICGEDDRLQGMLTDRDIVVKVIAEGKDPKATTASELAQGRPIYVEADASVSDIISTLADNKIRRVPVIEDKKLVGIISLGDLAKKVDEEDVGRLLEVIAKSP